MKKKIITIIIFLFLSNIYLTDNLTSTTVQKHFLNAKLSYINSDFDAAWNECKTSLTEKEISNNEAEAFFDLIRYVRGYSEKKIKNAEKSFAIKSYLKVIQSLSEVLKKDSKNKKAINLYKKTLSYLSEESKEMLLHNINKEIKINKKIKNEAFLISLYTEKLILTDNDNQTKLELKKVRLRYHSKQTQLEIKKMIEKLEQLIALKDFSLDEGKLIVNNILYIDPDNRKAKELKNILLQYEKALKEKTLKETALKKKEIKEKMIKEIKKTIKKKFIPVKVIEKSLKIKITNIIIQAIDIGKKEIKKEKAKKKQKESKAKIHFNLGVNRYNKQLYTKAKDEFIIAKSYNPKLKKVNLYIEKCKQKEKKIEKKKNIEIKHDIKKSKTLIKEKKIEKAINLLYNNIIKKNINNIEGEKYLKKIFKKNFIKNKLSINKYSSLFEILSYFKKQGIYFYNKKYYSKSIIYWEGILKLFPENKLALSNWYNNIKKIKKPKKYLEKLYSKGVEYYNAGDYFKSLFCFTLISRASIYYKIKYTFKNLKSLQKKCQKNIDKLSKTENQLSQIYNAAILDFINGNYAHALAKWEYILKIEPGNIKARYNLNKVNYILSRGDEIDKIKQLSDQDRKKITQTYYKGIIAYNNNKYKKAIYWFKKVLQIYPRHPKAINNINKLKTLLSLKEK